MSKLQTPSHMGVRTFLRVAGVLAVALGLGFTAVGMVSFFSAFGTGAPPRLFWCGFVGLPLLFFGVLMCKFGFMGVVLRYVLTEQTPVVTDAFSDFAEGSQEAIKTTARAVAEGVREARSETERRE